MEINEIPMEELAEILGESEKLDKATLNKMDAYEQKLILDVYLLKKAILEKVEETKERMAAGKYSFESRDQFYSYYKTFRMRCELREDDVFRLLGKLESHTEDLIAYRNLKAKGEI